MIIFRLLFILGITNPYNLSFNEAVNGDYFDASKIEEKLKIDLLVQEGEDLFLTTKSHKIYLNQNVNYQLYCFKDSTIYLLQEDINYGIGSKKFGRGFYIFKKNKSNAVIEINMNGGYDFYCYEFSNNSKLINFKYDYRTVFEETVFISKNNKVCR